jgi:hypothetical protein
MNLVNHGIEYQEYLFFMHTSNQTLPLLVHDPSFVCIRIQVVPNVISGNVCVLQEEAGARLFSYNVSHIFYF